MRAKVFIRWVAPKIGKIGQTMRIDVPAQLKLYTPDPKKLRHAVWCCAGDLSKEIVLKTVPGSRWLWRSLQGCVHKIQSIGSSSGELKEKKERMSRLEQEISSLKEERREWQMERLMLMASILALAAGANLRPPRN